MSGKNPIPNEQAYQGVRAVSPPNVVVAENAPGSNQKRVHLGDIQIDNASGIAYMLTDIVAGAQVWSVIGEGTTGDIITITGDSGGAQPGNAGNFNILGTAAQVLVTGTASTETISLIGPYAPATYTDHGVLVGSGAGDITALAVGSTGEVLIGSTGNDPAFGALGVNSGLTDHGVIVGSGNAALDALVVGTDGQVLVGATGADPVFATLTSGDGSITFTPGAGTLAMAVTAGSAVVKTATVTLTSAQVKNLVGTPIQLLAAQGAGTSIMIYQIQSKLVFGSNVFTNPQNIDVRTAGGNILATIVGSTFIDAAASTYNITEVAADTIIPAVDYENVAINLVNTATDITGNAANDNTLVVNVFYSVLTQ